MVTNLAQKREEYQARFKEAYDRLNLAQKEAVDTIEGPVMVIAGPGTGKTQILALRVANILYKTDTPPSARSSRAPGASCGTPRARMA